MLRLEAPAKINLSLDILGRRSDGYHEVRTVLQTIDLADELEFETAPDLRLTVEPDGAVPVDVNLVLRAARMLRDATHEVRGAAITLRKRIPVAAGLGGGSSDAAATLLGLCRLWGTELSRVRLELLARALGSDVPFFLNGGTALGTGRGEQVRALPMPVEHAAVILTPEGPTDGPKTQRSYDLLEERHFSDGSRTGEVVRRIEGGQPLEDTPFNGFEQVAPIAYPSFPQACTIFAAAGARYPVLSGAGPSLFALTGDEGEAEAVRARLQAEGHTAYTASLRPALADGMGG